MAIDGYSYSAKLLDLPGRFTPMALERIAFIRDNPAAWQGRDFVFPLKIDATLDAYGGQHIQQVTMVPGSVLIGYHAAAITGSLANFLIQVTFDFEGTQLFSAPIVASAFRPSGASGLQQVLLPEPKRISGTGIVTVTITNIDSTARGIQVILRVVEPAGGSL